MEWFWHCKKSPAHDIFVFETYWNRAEAGGALSSQNNSYSEKRFEIKKTLFLTFFLPPPNAPASKVVSDSATWLIIDSKHIKNNSLTDFRLLWTFDLNFLEEFKESGRENGV